MKTNVAHTSLMSIAGLRASGKSITQKQRIIGCLCDSSRPLTRREISNLTGLELGAVAGRVNSLIRVGVLLEKGSRPCTISKITAKTVELSPLEKIA